MANEGIYRDPLLKMLHNPGGGDEPASWEDADNPQGIILKITIAIKSYLEPQTTIKKWMFGDFQPFPM